MSKCGYYYLEKGKPVCKHPTEPRHGDFPWACDMCKRRCGGIWPSQLPTVDFRGMPYDVVNGQGKVLATFGG